MKTKQQAHFFFTHFWWNVQSTARAGGREKKSRLIHTWPTYARRGTWASLMDSSTKFGVGPEESSSLCCLNPDSRLRAAIQSSYRKQLLPPRAGVRPAAHKTTNIYWGGGGGGGYGLGSYLSLMEKGKIMKKEQEQRVTSCCLATPLVCGDVR